MAITRRRFLKIAGWSAAGAALVGTGAGIYGAHHLRVENIEIPLRRWPAELDGFRLVQITDPHYGSFTTPHDLEQVVEKANSLRPDLIVLTGDYVTLPVVGGDKVKVAGDAAPCAEIFRALTARLGVYGVLGNHDAWSDPDRIAAAFNAAKLPMLREEVVAIDDRGARFWLIGSNDALSGQSYLWQTVRKRPGKDMTILLVHEPDFADYTREYRIDLQLSGHSHGGQVRFPLLGAPYYPPMSRKYPAGLYRLGNLKLYTSRGIGTTVVPFRINCPPELTCITLRSAPAEAGPTGS